MLNLDDEAQNLIWVFPLAADEMLKVRKEKALIQTTLDEVRGKHKRDVEALKENIRKSHSEMDAARKLHETEMMVMKDTCDRREEELKRIRAEAVKASQVGTMVIRRKRLRDYPYIAFSSSSPTCTYLAICTHSFVHSVYTIGKRQVIRDKFETSS